MRKSKWRPHTQLSLVQRRKDDPRGGFRPGAGRPRKPGSISHAARKHLAARFPQHVTLRLVDGAPSLARAYLLKIIRAAICASHKSSFRVVEFNVLANHLHLITEAAGNDSRARGAQGLEVRLARRLNSALKRFDGWAEPIRREHRADEPAPTARATTWLLAAGWRKHGPLGFDERPG
jgi:REP element-mobilizing transposase RayT